MNNFRIGFFGHFGRANFGNDAALQAILPNLRRLMPNAEMVGICTYPDAVKIDCDLQAVPIRKPAKRHLGTSVIRRAPFAFMREIARWFDSIRTMRSLNALIIPGTGLLTDAYSFFDGGPYDLFRWTLSARLTGRPVFFVSVGGGPFLSRRGRWFLKSALSLASYRSFRDEFTLECLQSIGFSGKGDRIYPDLAFSLPVSNGGGTKPRLRRKLVVGVGIMLDTGKYGTTQDSGEAHTNYLESLAEFVQWLLSQECDVRLLTGDVGDATTVKHFKERLNERFAIAPDDVRIIDETVTATADLIAQIDSTDLVVATRFHNILLALHLDKPTMAISFHPKCASLMDKMGLGDYCRDMNHVTPKWLIDTFIELRRNADTLEKAVTSKTDTFRQELDQQYSEIVRALAQ